MRKVMLITILAASSGCATSTGVVPMGQDTFMVSREDKSPGASMGAVKVEALREAGAFCGDKGGDYQVISSNDVPRSFAQFPQVSLQFRCVQKTR